MIEEDVALKLQGDEALVLFEFLNGLIETGTKLLPAERAVTNRLIGKLESVLTSPFSEDYKSLLDSARARVAAKGGY